MPQIDIVEVTPAHVEELLVVRRAVDAELAPDRPAIDAEELALETFQVATVRPQVTWLARVAGEPAGYLRFRLPTHHNRNHLETGLAVHADHRGGGVARALLDAALEATPPARDMLEAWVEGDVAAAWCERLGLSNRQIVRQSRLDVADVDAEQQREWMEAARARAEGYRVVSWCGAFPEEYIDEIATAYDAMDDTPLDDVEHEFVTTTPELLRDFNKSFEGRLDLFCSLALSPTGEAAGITDLSVYVRRPALGDQGDTAVSSAHRGRAIGRWLKAANLAAARAAHPELAAVYTYNAESNPWMLAINEDMGFRPYKEIRVYQGPREGAINRSGG